MRNIKKHYDEMNLNELRSATQEFDRELPVGPDGLPGKRLSPSQRAKWKRVQKKMGRPKLGRGVKRVMISLEADLLKKSDRFAKRLHLNRSQLISAGLRRLMAD